MQRGKGREERVRKGKGGKQEKVKGRDRARHWEGNGSTGSNHKKNLGVLSVNYARLPRYQVIGSYLCLVLCLVAISSRVIISIKDI